MTPMTIRIALAGCLLLGTLGTAGAMTPERKSQVIALTTDAKTLWEALPALASDARKTALLIKDFEEFANLPAGLVEGVAEGTPRNCAAAMASLNPDYQIHLWLDDQSGASLEAIKGQRCRIRHVDQILNHDSTSEEARGIYRLAVSRSGYKANFAAASDVLRILILLSEGGVYLDTDTCVEKREAACGFGQLKAKYGFLVSTQTLQRDGQFNNSPMAAVPGSAALRELLALAEKRYRDAAHVGQPAHGRGPGAETWLYWVATGSRTDLRLSSTVFLCGPVLVADYLSRLGLGWLQAKNIKLDGHVQPGPPAVEWFSEEARRVSYSCPSSIAPVEDYFFIDNVYGDFDLTSETFGLSHKFDNSWLSSSPWAAPGETKESGSAGSAGKPKAGS